MENEGSRPKRVLLGILATIAFCLLLHTVLTILQFEEDADFWLGILGRSYESAKQFVWSKSLILVILGILSGGISLAIRWAVVREDLKKELVKSGVNFVCGTILLGWMVLIYHQLIVWPSHASSERIAETDKEMEKVLKLRNAISNSVPESQRREDSRITALTNLLALANSQSAELSNSVNKLLLAQAELENQMVLQTRMQTYLPLSEDEKINYNRTITNMRPLNVLIYPVGDASGKLMSVVSDLTAMFRGRTTNFLGDLGTNSFRPPVLKEGINVVSGGPIGDLVETLNGFFNKKHLTPYRFKTVTNLQQNQVIIVVDLKVNDYHDQTR